MKILLKITAFDYEKGKSKLRGESFTVMMNPSEYSHSRGITYNKDKKQGQVGAENKFADFESERVNFSLVLDGTGVVPPAAAGTKYKSVVQQMKDLNKVVYNYDGAKHQPNHVSIVWGTLLFFGRLQSLSTKYTLFSPVGEPLRARLELAFVSTMSEQEQVLAANASSPDLSHIVEVREGDTLPLLCQRIYGDSSYYPEVARINNLIEFRNLEPGGRLHFPPLE
jgi:Contractile injection system tube protein